MREPKEFDDLSFGDWVKMVERYPTNQIFETYVDDSRIKGIKPISYHDDVNEIIKHFRDKK